MRSRVILKDRVAGTTLVMVVIGMLMLSACGTDGTPQRAAPQEPLRCSTTDCPELPVFAAKRLAASGVESSADIDKVTAYMTKVFDDLDTAWQDWFAQLNIEQTMAGRVLIAPNEKFVSECLEDDMPNGIPSDFPNAFFCPKDTQADGRGTQRTGTIILPVEIFSEIWDGKLLGSDGFLLGDFSAATIIAHEYGHNIVFRLQKAYGIDERPAGDNSELIADCFAGNWAATVFERRDLSFTAMLQAAALMISIGDATPGQGHGTAFQRARALWKGFSDNLKRQGQPGDCLSTYWPEALQQ